MVYETKLSLSPRDASVELNLRANAAMALNLDPNKIKAVVPVKRSIDARQHDILIHLMVKVYVDEEPEATDYTQEYPNVKNADPIVIVGAGPAGLFAALRCIELGFKPIVLERGKDVQARRRDLAAINKDHVVNPDSNYCFGEGGAGTYSDGKLYTRSKKRGDVQRILEALIAHGADENITVDAHPHIGTNKLPKIIAAIRGSIIEAGGEVVFDARVVDFNITNGEIKSVTLQNGDKIEGRAVILATGHSARDIYYLLDRKKIHIEAKPFAMGVRAEHAQEQIDQIQYKCTTRDEYLPAAPYSLVSQVHDRGVYSFCMCPGGFVVPSATGPEEVVVNGMSPSKRDSKYANSGIVVSIDAEDLKDYADHGPLAGLQFQRDLEKIAYDAGGQTQTAPAQRLLDFVEGKSSSSLLDTSYQPGVTSAPLHELLPDQIGKRLRKGFRTFGHKMSGYLTNEAQILGVESRTSSPVRIPRDRASYEHVQIKGLYPCGEGAGYAGGIISAAVDGEKCAEHAIAKIKA